MHPFFATCTLLDSEQKGKIKLYQRLRYYFDKANVCGRYVAGTCDCGGGVFFNRVLVRRLPPRRQAPKWRFHKEMA
jgi:hypothetical protein